jgi:Tol biopolymer transport system component
MNTLLNWRDRNGELLRTIGDPGAYWDLSLSHDGTRVAVAVGQDASDIWIYDLERDIRTRFTFDNADDAQPLWSPDDSRLVFQSARKTAGEIYVRPTSGQGDAELLFTANTNITLSDWSRDGRLVFFSRMDLSADSWDIWTLDMQTSEANPVLAGRFAQTDARLSPDGRWLAYTSDESGKTEVYVQSFPEAAGRWMVSSDRGPGSAYGPQWRGDSHELYYMRGSAVLAVPVTGSQAFSSGAPVSLFSVNMKSSDGAVYAVSEDGQRILANELPPTDPGKVGARLIQNWTASLAR